MPRADRKPPALTIERVYAPDPERAAKVLLILLARGNQNNTSPLAEPWQDGASRPADEEGHCGQHPSGTS